MSTHTIDFFELAFLAEACIPPRPIARMMFWQNLTNVYWNNMTEGERAHIFDWLNKNPWYPESLEKEDETKIFHARFDPDNQYMVKTLYEGKEEEHRAFRLNDRFYTGSTKFIADEYIVEANKFIPEREY
jgi:hypothetical protein